MSARCECCDLLLESCGRAKQTAQRAARRQEIEYLRAVGWFASVYAGKCVHCSEWFEVGALIRRHADGWLAECCSSEIS